MSISKQQSRRRITSPCLSAAVLAALVASPALATNYTYVGSSTGDVNVAANWNPNGVPTAGDTVIFDAAAAGLYTLTNGGAVTTAGAGLTLSVTSANALTIDSTAALWRLGNNAITVAAGAGPFSLGNGSGTAVTTFIGSGGGTTQTFTNNSSSVATINSDVVFNGSGNGFHTMTLAGTGDWVLNNQIRNINDITASDGEFAVTKSGTGTVTLAGNNLYSRNTTVTAGTLKASTNTALGFGGQYSINRAAGITAVDGTTAAATLDLGGATTVNEPITLNGAANGVSLVNGVAGSTVKLDNGIALVTFSNNGGTAYTTSTGANSPVTAFVGGGGTGATASALKGGSAAGSINTVRMTNPGTGYTSAPTVTITGTNGETGAVATAVLSSLTLTGTNNNIGGDGNLVINAGIRETAAGGGFTKIGAGTTTLGGVNTFTGVTTVSAGTLLVNSTAANVALNGGTLGGTGTVGGVTVNGGATLAPGNGVGTLAASGLAFATGGTYSTDIGAGTSADMVAVAGLLDLTAVGDTLNLVGPAANFDGSAKTIATYASLLGVFDSVTLNGVALVGSPAAFTVNGQTYAVNYGTGTNGAITLTSAVPEPAALAAIGLVGGLCLRRRRA